MPNVRPSGPYPIPGINMETWLVRFDKNGVCSSPKTRDVLLDNLAVKKDRSVVFFSHGWNNDFADAVDLYRRFLSEFEKVLSAHPIAGLSPIFVGVTWPSIWLPSDAGPQMAASNGDPKAASAEEAILRELVEILPTGTDWSRLYTLFEGERISLDEAHELARLLAPALRPSNEGGPEEAAASEANIVKALTDIQRADGGQHANDDLDAIGLVGETDASDVAAAGLLGHPRPALSPAPGLPLSDEGPRWQGRLRRRGRVVAWDAQADPCAHSRRGPFIRMQGDAIRRGHRAETEPEAQINAALATCGIAPELCRAGARARWTGRLSRGA